MSAGGVSVDAADRENHLTPAPVASVPVSVPPPLADVADASPHVRHERLRNVVLMGMGEPLHNYDAVMTALDILRDGSGFALGAKRISLSTVGVVPGIIRLADEARPIHLAVSLHGATQEERAALVPVAKKWPLDTLMEACRYYIAKRQCRIFYEWTLIEGKNDTAENAHAVGRLLQGQLAQVNLIPLNPTAGFDGVPTGQVAAKKFQAILAEYGLPSTIRQRRGIDIAAGLRATGRRAEVIGRVGVLLDGRLSGRRKGRARPLGAPSGGSMAESNSRRAQRSRPTLTRLFRRALRRYFLAAAVFRAG